MVTEYTDNERSADKLELRPFAGVKLFVPNDIKWTLYNFTRYEFRDTQNLDTHDWTAYSRLRSRFGVEFPLTSRERAWEPRTWYGLADVEPIFRFDHNTIDPLYVRGGIGYVLAITRAWSSSITLNSRGQAEVRWPTPTTFSS